MFKATCFALSRLNWAGDNLDYKKGSVAACLNIIEWQEFPRFFLYNEDNT